MSWLLAALGFMALIVLHELGHFAAAKAVGMRVERFMLFFPPILFKVRRGETEYGIGAIPLGGYVRISGMSPREELPEDVARRGYLAQPVWKRLVVITAGPLVNVLVAFAILWGLFLANGSSEPTRRIAAIESGQAATGVLEPGDRVLMVDGRAGSVEQLSKQIASHRCAGAPRAGCRATAPARIAIERAGARRTVTVVPRYDAELRRTRVGFAFARRTRDAGPLRAADLSAGAMWRVTSATVEAIVHIFDRSDEISGVVGSYEVTRQSFDFDAQQALNVLAIISLSLAIVNLFPFLPLDGGHIFWALAEKLRRRPISFAVMERSSVIGFMLVMVLFVIGLTNDIERLRGEGFGVR